MKQPWVYMCSASWSPLPPPSPLTLESIVKAMQSVIFSLILAWLFHLNKFGIIAFILIYFLLLLDEVYFHRHDKPSAFTFFIFEGYCVDKQMGGVRKYGDIKKQIFSTRRAFESIFSHSALNSFRILEKMLTSLNFIKYL